MDAQSTGFVVWITGMSRAGKSSLAEEIAKRLRSAGRSAEVLDESDDVIGSAPGEGSDAVCYRMGRVAKLLARNGVAVICAILSPHREAREGVRRDLKRFLEVFVDCPMTSLQARDSGGLYEKALKGELKNVAGIDAPYEPPTHADVVVHSEQESVEQESLRVGQLLVDLKYIAPSEFIRLSGGQRPKRSRPAPAAKAQERKAPGKSTKRPAPARAAKGGPHSKAGARKIQKKIAARTAKPKRR